MKINIAVIFSIFAFLTIQAVAETIPKTQPHAFTARVSKVRVNSYLIAQGKKQDDKVSVSVPSILFTPALKIEDVRTSSTNTIPEINTLISYMKANIDGSEQEYLSFWYPTERPAKAKLISNPKVLQANRDYLRKSPGLTIVGIVFQEKTTSILLKSGQWVHGVTLVKEDSKYFMTDNPSNDLELAIIEASFASE